jgi:hypothetical protein
VCCSVYVFIFPFPLIDFLRRVLSLPLLATRVFGLEILLVLVLAPFSPVLIFLQSSAQLPIFFIVPSFILVPPVSLQSSLQIDFSCGIDSCIRSSVSHQNLLASKALGHNAS